MRRRGKSGSPFSLFSFQDIITSVTAIMILMTLLLCLELVTRKFGKATAEAAPPSRPAEDIRQEIQEIKQRYQTLSQELESNAELLARVAGSTQEDLAQEAANTRRQQERIESEIEQLMRILEASKQDVKRSTTAASKVDLESLQALREKIEKTKKKLNQLQSSNALFFRADEDVQRNGWLVDVSGKRIRVEKLGQPANNHTFTSFAVSSFRSWLKGQGGSGCYCLVLIRPSGIATGEEVRQAIRDQRVTMGLDLIGEYQQIMQNTGNDE